MSLKLRKDIIFVENAKVWLTRGGSLGLKVRPGVPQVRLGLPNQIKQGYYDVILIPK